jgi:hypothetical protein
MPNASMPCLAEFVLFQIDKYYTKENSKRTDVIFRVISLVWTNIYHVLPFIGRILSYRGILW